MALSTWLNTKRLLYESEATSYMLTVADYSGNAGNFMSYHNVFTTYDRDNDERQNSPENCVSVLKQVVFGIEIVSDCKERWRR